MEYAKSLVLNTVFMHVYVFFLPFHFHQSERELSIKATVDSSDLTEI